MVAVWRFDVMARLAMRATRRRAAAGYSQAANFFVSKNGNNTTGTSWANAWTDFNSIAWGSVTAGSIIEVDGGSSRATSNYRWTSDANHATARPGVSGGMLYTGAFLPTVSGTSGNPITIRLSRDTGRDGTAVIFGGRQTALPYASQSSYTATGTGRDRGIDLRGRGYITIDGDHRSGFMVYGIGTGAAGANSGNAASGVALSVTSNNIILRNLEIFDCGTFNTGGGASGSVTGYVTDQEGITLAGSNITIDRCLIHDCGQDPIQGVDTVTSLSLTNSWIYSNRDHPTWTGYPFNCGSEAVASQEATHVDGMQIYAGVRAGPLTIDHCVWGPLISKGPYPGDQNAASYDNVTMTECLFVGCIVRSIQGDSFTGTPTTPSGWLIDHCTSVQGTGQGTGYSSGRAMADISGTGHAVRNSIKINGNFGVTGSFTGTNSNNYYTGGSMPGGTATDPAIVQSYSTNDPIYTQTVAIDATPTNSTVLSSGAGTTHIRKIQDLLDRIDTLNGQ